MSFRVTAVMELSPAGRITARRPKTRYAVGYGAKPMIFLHSVLPDRGFDAFIRRATGVPAT